MNPLNNQHYPRMGIIRGTNHCGFSLIELLITVCILGIISTFALPAYTKHIARTHTTEAFNALTLYQLQMQQYYQDNGNYGAGAVCGLAFATTKHFGFTCAVAGDGFTLTATANGIDNLNGYNFTIDDGNNQRTTAYPDASIPATCWLTNSGGC